MGLIYSLMRSCRLDHFPAPCHYSKMGGCRASQDSKKANSLYLQPIPSPVGAPMGPGPVPLHFECAAFHTTDWRSLW